MADKNSLRICDYCSVIVPCLWALGYLYPWTLNFFPKSITQMDVSYGWGIFSVSWDLASQSLISFILYVQRHYNVRSQNCSPSEVCKCPEFFWFWLSISCISIVHFEAGWKYWHASESLSHSLQFVSFWAVKLSESLFSSCYMRMLGCFA